MAHMYVGTGVRDLVYQKKKCHTYLDPLGHLRANGKQMFTFPNQIT